MVSDGAQEPWSPPGLRGPWPPDEYLCDGGDGQIIATVGTDLTVHGVEMEDALLHFDSLDGRTTVLPTNRVCIYAPRFAAVRKVTGIEESERHLHMHRLDGQSALVDIDDRQRPTHVEQPIGAVRKVGTRLANSLDELA
jgi:hypothetical protein